MATNGITGSADGDTLEASGKLVTYQTVVIDGNSHVYFTLEGKDDIFDVDLSVEETLTIIKYKEGDMLTVRYVEGDVLSQVTEIK